MALPGIKQRPTSSIRAHYLESRADRRIQVRCVSAGRTQAKEPSMEADSDSG